MSSTHGKSTAIAAATGAEPGLVDDNDDEWRWERSRKEMRPRPGISVTVVAACEDGLVCWPVRLMVSCITVCASPLELWSATSGMIFCRWFTTASMSSLLAISTSHRPGIIIPLPPLPNSLNTKLFESFMEELLLPWLDEELVIVDAVLSTSVITSGDEHWILYHEKVTDPAAAAAVVW